MYSPFLVAFLPLPLFLPPLPFPLAPPHSNLLLHQLPSKLSLKILSAINLEFLSYLFANKSFRMDSLESSWSKLFADYLSTNDTINIDKLTNYHLFIHVKIQQLVIKD